MNPPVPPMSGTAKRFVRDTRKGLAMKTVLVLLVLSFCSLVSWKFIFRNVVEVKSTLDGAMQKCFVFVPDNYRENQKTPLLVQLHSWGGDYAEKTKVVQHPANKRGWLAICPNYRGDNKNPMACASKFAIQDIVDAVDYMCGKYNVDKNRIYLCGGSGGGHMALVMAAKHPEIWAAVASFVPITDIKKWYQENDPLTAPMASVAEKRNAEVIRNDIIGVCGGDPEKDFAAGRECMARSPITFLEGAKDLDLLIVSGRYDEDVPYHHGEDAYKKLLAAGSKNVRFVLADRGHYIDIEEGCAYLEQFTKRG